jgi:positive regulator of sigma E activity
MNILEIFTPTYHFTYQTSLSAQEVRKNVQNNLTPKDAKLPVFSLTNKRESYEGEVLENGFEISRRKKGGKNSFPAVVSGSITENQAGSKLVVEIKHPTYIKILILVTFIFLVIDIILAIVFRLIPLSEELIYLTTFFGVAFSFGFFVHFFNAKSEVKNLKKKIIEFVEGEK